MLLEEGDFCLVLDSGLSEGRSWPEEETGVLVDHGVVGFESVRGKLNLKSNQNQCVNCMVYKEMNENKFVQ